MVKLDFERDVLERSRKIPVLVDFLAPWCAPCRALGPVLEAVAERYSERLALVKINTEEFPELASRYGVRGIPNVKLFVDGEPVDEFTGALPEAQIVQWLEKAIPGPEARKFQEAEQALAAGDQEKARSLLEQLVESDPEHPRARLLLARSWLLEDPHRAVFLLEPVRPGSDAFEEAEVLRDLARLLLLRETPETLPEEPGKDSYLKAAAALAAQDYQAALENLIEVVEKNRELDNEGARKGIIALFHWLGNNHPLTRQFRSRLASVLY